MEKKTLKQLSDKTNWKEAVIVFTEDTFTKFYSEKERSYTIYSDAKYFNPKMNGSSLHGNCLDGKDDGVRLDHYIYDGWKIDYCYIVG